MKQKLIIFLFSFLLFHFSFSPAQSSQMRLEGKPQKSSDEIVGKHDANGRFCAAIQVISDLDGFSYDAYNGVVDVDHRPGKDMVYLQPDERVLEIYKSGYEPLKIILSDVGIHLQERAVWRIKISGDAKTGDLLPVTLLPQPADAVIVIDGKTVQPGKPVKLSKGKHSLRIFKEGYKEINREITVDENNVLFNYSLKEVDLQPVQIKSVPSEAQIFINGQDKGVTDRGLYLYPGNYALKILKPGYVEINRTITVSETGNNTFSFNLVKNSGLLNLTVTPAGAEVLINKENYSNRTNIELAPGRYKIEISKPGYYPRSETVTIERGQTLNKTYTLTAKTGKLQFTIQPLDAKVTLKQNGLTVQSWTGMKYIKNLPVGDYELVCSADGYRTLQKQFRIDENRMTALDLTMEKGASTNSAPGSLSLASKDGTTGTMTDQDGNVYKTVKIGNQIWMAENLRVTHYRDGDPIPNVTDNTEWINLSTGAWCAYDNDNNNINTYGLLYNWYAVIDSRNIAPAGWHVPTDEEWKQLEKYLGSNAGGKLKERGTSHWKKPNTGGTNFSGFTALPGGYRYYLGAFGGIGSLGYWWSSTAYISDYAWSRYLGYGHSGVGRNASNEHYGFSVRLLRD